MVTGSQCYGQRGWAALSPLPTREGTWHRGPPSRAWQGRVCTHRPVGQGQPGQPADLALPLSPSLCSHHSRGWPGLLGEVGPCLAGDLASASRTACCSGLLWTAAARGVSVHPCDCGWPLRAAFSMGNQDWGDPAGSQVGPWMTPSPLYPSLLPGATLTHIHALVR